MRLVVPQVNPMSTRRPVVYVCPLKFFPFALFSPNLWGETLQRKGRPCDLQGCSLFFSLSAAFFRSNGATTPILLLSPPLTLPEKTDRQPLRFPPPPFRRKGRGYFLTLLNAFLCPAALDWLFYSSHTKLQPSVCAKEEEVL